jgi:hypothetical protein
MRRVRGDGVSPSSLEGRGTEQKAKDDICEHTCCAQIAHSPDNPCLVNPLLPCSTQILPVCPARIPMCVRLPSRVGGPVSCMSWPGLPVVGVRTVPAEVMKLLKETGHEMWDGVGAAVGMGMEMEEGVTG